MRAGSADNLKFNPLQPDLRFPRAAPAPLIFFGFDGCGIGRYFAMTRSECANLVFFTTQQKTLFTDDALIDRLAEALVDVWDRLGLTRVDQVLAAE